MIASLSFHRIAAAFGLATCAMLFMVLSPIRSLAQETAAITDLRIENGELRWTAPANVARYGVQYYTGETTDRTKRFGGCQQAGADYTVRFDGREDYCGWTPGTITRQEGATESLRNGSSASDRPTYSYVVYSYDIDGQRSAVSNVVVYPGYSIPVPVITSLPPPVQGVVQLEVGDTVRFTLQNILSGFIGSAFMWHWDTSLLQCSGYPDFDSPEFRCTARQSGESDVSITLFDGQVNESSRESNRIRVRVESDVTPVTLPQITDLRIENGELRWTAPANVSRYSIRFYTGETTSRSAQFHGCGSDSMQLDTPNGSRYCAGEAVSITRRSGHEERLRIGQSPVKSFVVSYADGRGGQSEVSNVVVHEISGDTTTIPPAGYEDEVLTNIDTYDNPFPDTSMQTLAGKAAAELYRRAVIGGFPDGEFKGDRSVNRAEAAKFLLLARYGSVGNVVNNGRFPDVRDGEWYTPYVMIAAQKGIIQGHPDGLFRPADTVNTAEFLKMLANTFDLDVGLSHSYTDIPGDSWYVPYAGIAQRYSLFPNRTTRLYPERALTRAEVAVAIYQYLQHR